MKIVFLESNEQDQAFLSKAFGEHELLFIHEPLGQEHIPQLLDAAIVSPKSVSKLTKDVLAQLSNLKLVVTRTTGFDHIDVEYCRERNITVCNIPDYGSYTVAEHAFALLLVLTRKILPSVEWVKKREFRTTNLQGIDLHGKTIGVIGAGNIGQYVINIAKGFGMEVISYSVPVDEHLAASMGFRFVDLQTLLSESDVISLHVPYTPKTHHLINMDNLQQIKKGVILINTARGGVVDSKALIRGLEDGILGGVGLDVFENEEKMKQQSPDAEEVWFLVDQLMHMENVIITPHNGYNSRESRVRVLESTVENISDFLSGTATNVV